jgi:hypothetical protein
MVGGSKATMAGSKILEISTGVAIAGRRFHWIGIAGIIFDCMADAAFADDSAHRDT